MAQTVICILLFFSFLLTEFSFPYSDNIVWNPHKCPGYRLPVSLSTCFWASCHNRVTYMVPPGMPDMQPKANPFPNDGTTHTFPSGLFSEYCLPHFLSDWRETFPLFWYGDRMQHTDNVPDHAILHSYDKLLISSIMTSNMLCKVRVKVGL